MKLNFKKLCLFNNIRSLQNKLEIYYKYEILLIKYE
uniref:Uncharacterized protein n=1 Tax=Chondria sp. (in: red algae) TaxID=1982705 RepID=A0A1Z1MDB1_9FLOR|nr:hypothetical protein [Chondria sp. (in: red algae)]